MSEAQQQSPRTSTATSSNRIERPKTVARPKKLKMAGAPTSTPETEASETSSLGFDPYGDARRRAEAQRRANAERARSKPPERRKAPRRMGMRTQALLIIFGCFAASAALRAGDFLGREANKTINAKPTIETATTGQPPVSAEAVALGALETGQIAPAPGATNADAASSGGTAADLARQAAEALGVEAKKDSVELDLDLGLGLQTGDNKRTDTKPVDPPSPEAAELLAALRRREAELAAHAAKLDARERELAAVEKRIAERIRQLEREREVFSGLLASLEQATKKDVDHLVRMYSQMKAKQAARLFNTMDPGFAAGFLVRMQAKKASEILGLMEPQRAYAVSLRMAGRNVRPGDPPVKDKAAAGGAK